MTIAEYRAVESVASTLPSIGQAIERMADALDRIATAEEQHLKIVVAAFARQADTQLPAASASGTPTPTTDKE